MPGSRRAYKTPAQQAAANQRYMSKNTEEKRRAANYRSMKSTAKRFVKLATDTDLQETLQLMQGEIKARGLI